MKKEEKKLIIVRTIVAVVILILGVVLFKVLGSGGKAPGQKDEDGAVRTLAGTPIKLTPVRAVIKTYGSVRPSKEVTISSELTGKIVYVKSDIKNGMIVKKDEIIAKIDETDYEIALNKAVAKIDKLKAAIAKQKLVIANDKLLLEAAKKQFELEKNKYLRVENLVTKKVYNIQKAEVAKQGLEDSKSKYFTAQSTAAEAAVEIKRLEAELKLAESEKQETELKLKRCVLKSPFHGRLDNVSVEKDEYATVGKNLFEVVDDESLEIPIALTADEAGMVLDFTPGKNKDYSHWFKYNEENPISIEWQDKSGKFEWKGKIIGVEKFDADTRMITVLVKPMEAIKEHEENFPLVAGMFCKVVFTGKKMDKALGVPLNAIQLNGCIYVVDRKTNKVQAQKVKIIRYDDYQAIISSKGLKEGDYLVTQPLPSGILDGTKVKIVEPLK